jgi:hypothetical protein
MGIDKDIPPPPPQSRADRQMHYAKQLEVGDSYFVACSADAAANAVKLAYRAPNCGHKKFRREKRTEGGLVGFRIWRIE